MRLLFASVLILGCAEPADLAQVEQGVLCSDIWCGMNSSKLGDIYTHELRLDGLPNDEGFQITKVVHNNDVYTLLVENGQIALKGDLGTLTMEMVEGALIFVENIHGGEYVIRIEGTELTPYWAKTDAEMRTYQLMWSDVYHGEILNEWTNVCTNPHVSKIDTRAMKAYTALVFEGDRVDGKAKTVGAPDLNYFNIGCAGHALAKMALTGHSYPGQKAGLVTTREQRQTFLKMITADYCGDGTAFTVPGTHLDWMADQEWLPYAFKDNHLEARWTKDGATCLDTFRLVANNNETGGGMFPDGVKAAVDAQCGIPPACLNQQVDDLDGNYMVSATPN